MVISLQPSTHRGTTRLFTHTHQRHHRFFISHLHIRRSSHAIHHQGPPCINTCVKKEAGFSTDCTACFGTFGVCVAASCLVKCLPSTPPDPAKDLECGECTESKCLPALNSCTKPNGTGTRANTAQRGRHGISRVCDGWSGSGRAVHCARRWVLSEAELAKKREK